MGRRMEHRTEHKKECRNRWYHVILSLLTGIVIAAAVAVIAAFVYGIRPYIVMSGSMEPAIATGSVCFVDTKVPYEEICVGDTIVFRQKNGMVTHRVVSITQEGMETKGDANDRSDGITTTPENYFGETIWSVPYAGYVLHTLRTPQALWIAMILLGAMILWEVIDRQESL